ncbi:threonine aldolase family protein [Chitinophaga sancti]|uniref:threonine aldolase family protein n=1 Tax=Chitinophaga sancti TaxID=1004 RepID=UPI003F78C3B8
MISFKNDYSEGALPAILQALADTNQIQQGGYGDDDYTQQAIELIHQKIGNTGAAIHLVSGGTQANLTFISSVLRPYESAIAATTGHIFHHETGAIEATGHKIETVFAKDGKLTPALIASVVDKIEAVHMPLPRLVYISNSTELGTHYMRAELIALYEYCQRKGLVLFLDGARLASGMQAGDIRYEDLAKYTDAFYIGGTKNGALIGEAIVINNPSLQDYFSYNLKMRGALLAKGRLLGIQFRALFKGDTYLSIGAYMNEMAGKLSAGIKEAGYEFLIASKTNQIFPVLPWKVIKALEKNYAFYVWQELDEEHAAIRLVTSWNTRAEAVEQFVMDLKACGQREK